MLTTVCVTYEDQRILYIISALNPIRPVRPKEPSTHFANEKTGLREAK